MMVIIVERFLTLNRARAIGEACQATASDVNWNRASEVVNILIKSRKLNTSKQ